MQKITPIILAGGIGSRLWPLSRESFPKQFLKIDSELSLFQQTVQRFQTPTFSRPVVITHDRYRFHIVEQMGEIGTLPELILLEPVSRNTAGAVLAAVTEISARNPDTLCLVAPADHVIPDGNAFRNAVTDGVDAALARQLVTFGILPDRPETGYGYLEVGGTDKHSAPTLPVLSFTEKPDLQAATRMMVGGCHLWNAGIFLFHCAALKDAYARHAPDIVNQVAAALSSKHLDLGFTRLEAEAWHALPDISLDYAVMEKADNICAVRFDGHWSDLGSWQGYWREGCTTAPQQRGVVTIGNAHGIDCNGSFLMSEDTGQTIIGLGVTDLVAVATKDAVLVADRHRSNEIGKLVDHLKSYGVTQATTRSQDFRPWGWFEVLATGPGFKVKKITVHPRGVLSLQSHMHRAEHWVVVDGVASVTIGNQSFDLCANQSVFVPQGELHRLENNGTDDAVLIEVQTGIHLSEDDIIRYEDAYAR